MGAVGNDKLARRKLLHEVELEGRRLFYKAVVRHKRDAKADTRQVDLVEELPPRQLIVAHSSHLPIPQAAKEFMSMLEKGAE